MSCCGKKRKAFKRQLEEERDARKAQPGRPPLSAEQTISLKKQDEPNLVLQQIIKERAKILSSKEPQPQTRREARIAKRKRRIKMRNLAIAAALENEKSKQGGNKPLNN